MKFNNIRVYNFEHALRGMRNPKDSWHLIDSEFGLAPVDDVLKYCKENDKMPHDIILYQNNNWCEYAVLGPKDLKLAQALIKGGSEHRKFLRQIFVTVDITAPLYWWKEFDTYKVGTVANSCSTMHKIHAKEFTLDDFSHEHLLTDKCFIYPFRADGYYGGWEPKYILENVIDMLNTARELYIETKNKKYWWQMIQLLPTSYNQKRTVTLNYENLYAMSRQRESHKLNEWSGKDDPTLTNFLNFVHQLPWANELIFFE